MKTTALLLLFVSATFMSSCKQQIYPVTGNYPTTPIQIKSEKNFDQVWDNLIDLFAQKGLAIKIIDRSSGLIISDKSKLSVTIEDSKGGAKDPKAFIVVPSYKDRNTGRMIPVTGYWYVSKQMVPNEAEGEWNVRVKKTETGSVINVNITNMYYRNTVISNNKADQVIALTSGKTTGVFENMVADHIK